jgi:HNH endonuclease
MAGLAEWLAGLKMAWLESGACGHARQAAGYRPGPLLAHLITIRQRTCSFPGCRRPARRCDQDHTVPYDQGGRTCECNLAALCRAHHRAKQAPGWQLAQPEPGRLTWIPPHGRAYTVIPQPYLA